MDSITILLLQHRRDERMRESERVSFRAACGIAEERFRTIDAHRDDITTALLDGVDMLLISGSGYSVFDETPRKEDVRALVREADRRGIPILGVCFGAQLVAETFGGKVERDTENKEVGTFVMRRTEDGSMDALFADMPDRFPAQCAHQDRIMEIPPGAIILAKSERCPVQAFVIPGRDVYAVQFHPERTKADVLASIERDRQHVDPSAPGTTYAEVDPYDIEETPRAYGLIRTFIDRIALHRVRSIS